MMNSNAIDIVYFLDKRMYDSKWIKVLEEPEDIVFVTASGHPFVGRDSLDLDLVIDQPLYPSPNETPATVSSWTSIWRPRAKRYTPF